MNDSRVVDVIQPPPGLQCLQLIVAPKRLGTALVTVYDIGLVPPLSASSMVILLFIMSPLYNLFVDEKVPMSSREK